MQDQDEPACRRDAFPGGVKMSGHDALFVDSPVGQEPIRRLGVGPALAS